MYILEPDKIKALQPCLCLKEADATTFCRSVVADANQSVDMRFFTNKWICFLFHLQLSFFCISLPFLSLLFVYQVHHVLFSQCLPVLATAFSPLFFGLLFLFSQFSSALCCTIACMSEFKRDKIWTLLVEKSCCKAKVINTMLLCSFKIWLLSFIS